MHFVPKIIETLVKMSIDLGKVLLRSWYLWDLGFILPRSQQDPIRFFSWEFLFSNKGIIVKIKIQNDCIISQKHNTIGEIITNFSSY